MSAIERPCARCGVPFVVLHPRHDDRTLCPECQPPTTGADYVLDVVDFMDRARRAVFVEGKDRPWSIAQGRAP